MDSSIWIAIIALGGSALTAWFGYRSSTKANNTNDRKVDLDVHKDAIAALKEIIQEQDRHVDRIKVQMNEVHIQLAREQDVSQTLRQQIRMLQEQVDELNASRARLERAMAAQGLTDPHPGPRKPPSH